MRCPRCLKEDLQHESYQRIFLCPGCSLLVDEQEILRVSNIQVWWEDQSDYFQTWRAKRQAQTVYSPWWKGAVKAQPQLLQTQFDQQIRAMYDLLQQGINAQTGITDFMMGKPIRSQYEDPDGQLKQEMSRVLLDISGESFFPSTQLYQLANALLIENQSEFLLGVTDEELHFKEDWEVRSMRGSIDQEVAKVWINEEKGILCARFPYKPQVIDAIRAQIPKGKKSWNPDDKIWEFSVETVDVVVKILTESFQKVMDLTRPQPPMLGSQNGGDPLLSLLDEEDIQKIYKLLAKKYHPDMIGGDGGKMASINQIFKGRIK